VKLKTEKPKSPKYPKNLKSIGDHIRKKRLDLGLLQRNVAEQIAVSEATIYNWERNITSPQVYQIPSVIRFLDYDPFPPSKTFPERLVSVRRKLGLSQRAIAEKLGIDATTIGQWESGTHQPSRRLLAVFQGFVDQASSVQDPDR
jgi:transcriptional regulator with XRE-family HTH domain